MSDASNINTLLGLNVTGSTLSTGKSLFGEISIIALPPDLQNLDKMQILEGKILGLKKDGSVMISTEHGNVTISTDAPAKLQNRQEIELRLEAGNPPTKIALRPAYSDIDSRETKQTQHFDTHSVKTTLTKDAQTLSNALLGTQQLLSGVALQMTLFDTEEPIAQPFMRQTSSILTTLPVSAFTPLMPSAEISSASPPQKLELEAKISGVFTNKQSIVLEDSIAARERAAYPFTSTAQPFQNEVSFPPTEATTLPLQNTHNTASLPFRAIAVQIIGTSNETRISYERTPQASTGIEQSSPQQKRAASTAGYATAKQAEIKVRSIFPPQIQFTDTDPTRPQNTPHNAHNLHFTPVHAEHNNNRALLSSTIFSSRVGLATAIVEGFTQTRNLPVLRMLTPESLSKRLYALDSPVQGLPMGIQLEFEINPLSVNKEKDNITTSTQDNSIPMMNASHFLTLGNWPIMEEVQQNLVNVNAQIAKAFNASLPSASAPAQLGASILFFVAAIRSGDVQSWLGEKAVDALKRSGKSSLLGRISSELSGLSQMNKENLSGEWRAISIPLVWQNDVNKLVIYTNHDGPDVPDEDNNSSKGRKTRFVVDLSLSHIGPLQLDGLFSGSLGKAVGEAAGKLDLVLRTKQGFSQSMKQQMRSAYKNALDETRITGELSFQDHTLDWVHITPSKTAEYSENA
jgi:hypothetical protein